MRSCSRALASFFCVLVGCGEDAPDADAPPSPAGRDAASPTPADAGRPDSPEDDPEVYGQVYRDGQYHLGPVDFDETAYHNACAPDQKYLPAVRATAGSLLAGVWGQLPDVARFCDSCIRVDTAAGKSAVLRVVTYGDTSPNSLDVSPEAYALLNGDEFPRAMTWRAVRCPDTGPLQFEFRSGSHEYWTSFWVRNARVPIAKVEAKGAHHDFTEIPQESNGARVDYSGFGAGPFTIRVTAVDGQIIEEDFAYPAAGFSGVLLDGHDNFE